MQLSSGEVDDWHLNKGERTCT